jgi:N-acetylglutamate synthase-like GNAT family acetyltransferase
MIFMEINNFRHFLSNLRSTLINYLSPPQRNKQLMMEFHLKDNQSVRRLHLNDFYLFQTYNSDLDNQWVEFLNSSKEFGYWSITRLHNEIIDYLIPHCAIFVKDDNKICGCGALCKFAKFSKTATLMYLLVDVNHQRKKIGENILNQLILSAKELGYSKIILRTNDERISAIHLYLKMGFLPNLKYTPDAKTRWRQLLSDRY